MRRILLILAIFTAIFAASAQTDTISGPAVTFLPNATVDLGDIKSGDVAVGTVRLRNDGDEPLQIMRIFTGCSCMDADYPHDPIDPGKEAEIKVTFRSRGYAKGAFLKTMKVKSNAPSRIDRVFLKGRILE